MSPPLPAGRLRSAHLSRPPQGTALRAKRASRLSLSLSLRVEPLCGKGVGMRRLSRGGLLLLGGWSGGGGGGERTEQTNWGAPHSAPGKRVCAFGRRAARQRRGQTRVGDRRERRGADDSASMLSMQQFPALPAEEERYRQVLSARRVRQARKRPQAACEQGRGARPSPLCSHSLGLGWAAGRTGQCGVESLAPGLVAGEKE